MARTKETEIQAAICDYLAFRKVFFSRANNQPIYDPSRKIFRALPKYTQRGVADIWAVKGGKIYFIEVKRPDGRMSPDQKLFQQNAEAAGADYVLARSIDDVQRAGL